VGSALALTVLGRLAERGALVLASTHYGLLKAAVHDHPAMINAAMDYDEASLVPLFTLRLGNPGASHAFDIAARVGLDRALLDQARALVGEDRYQLERLLQDLASRARAVAAQEEESRQRLAGLQRRQEELDERLAGLARELQQARAQVRQDGEELLRQSRRRLEEAVRDVRQSGGDRVVVQRARDRLREVAEAVRDVRQSGGDRVGVQRARERLREGAESRPDAAPAAMPRRDLAPGHRVRVPRLGLEGQVVEVRGDRIGVLADGLSLNVERADVVPIAAEAPAAPAGPLVTAASWTWDADDPGIPPELDVRGLRGEEAWERLDRMLDRAMPVGLAELTVVHGLGTGRLRDHLLGRLAADPRVASFHPGGERQNNLGATVIHLR